MSDGKALPTSAVADASAASAASAKELEAIARILLDAIPPDKRRQNAWKVIAYLAEDAISATSAGKLSRRISTKEIHTDLGGNPNREPSGWMSRLWNDIEAQWYPAIKGLLIARCHEAGLSVYPELVKSDGNPAYYWVEAKKIEAEYVSENADRPEFNSSKTSIIYINDLSLKLSSAGRLFFGGGMSWTPVKRYSFITGQLIYLAFVLIYLMVIMLILWGKQGPLGGQELVMVILGMVVSYIAYIYGVGVWRLFDDRIIIAPDWTIAWKEYGATIEINRSNNRELPSTIHVNRYSAICPICGWMVKLDKGEPEFPRRLVGRCEENPREHVFSFDRSTKHGISLRPTSI